MKRLACVAASSIAVLVFVGAGCGSSKGSSGFGDGDDDGGSSSRDGGSDAVTFGDALNLGDSTGGDGMTQLQGDPTNCSDAAQYKTYIGCDYWPTVTANNVWSIFDFAAVVANGQSVDAMVTVTGPSNTNQTVMVPAGQLTKIYLPWVSALKGPDTDACGSAMPFSASVIAKGGAYHLVSSVPVTVYQFNALEYQGMGGPTGKSWSACPGTTQSCPQDLGPIGCFSFSNDASLLLPSTAMTGNYRVVGMPGWTFQAQGATPTTPVLGPVIAVTATQDGTMVTVSTKAGGTITAGGGVPGTGPNGTSTFMLDQGDVAEITGPIGSATDFAGSLVQANNPIQVITGLPCIDITSNAQACDHIEAANFPAETLGKDYFVTVPTSPGATIVGHVVRIVGNVDGTTLTYAPSAPAGCPSTINAGQVATCLGQVTKDFEVKGSNEFSVGSYMLGGSLQDPNAAQGMQEGDPSSSLSVAVEQYRTKYIFLAPSDYTESYVDIVGPTGVSVTLDGSPITASFTAIGSTGFGVARQRLGAGQAGAHVLTSTLAVGIQVMGYGAYTSYQYPGGLNLTLIAPPPPPPM